MPTAKPSRRRRRPSDAGSDVAVVMAAVLVIAPNTLALGLRTPMRGGHSEP